MNNEHPQWGGARPNSGPKANPDPTKRKHSHTFYCTDDEAKELRDYLNNVIRKRKDR
jgi:hypothetical protein